MSNKIKIIVRKEQLGKYEIKSPPIESNGNRFFIYAPQSRLEFPTMLRSLELPEQQMQDLESLASNYFLDIHGKLVLTVIDRDSNHIAMTLAEIVSLRDELNITPPGVDYNTFAGKGMGIIHKIYPHNNISQIDPELDIITKSYGALSEALFKLSRYEKCLWSGTVTQLNKEYPLADKVKGYYKNLSILPMTYTLFLGWDVNNPELLPRIQGVNRVAAYGAGAR